MARKHIHVCRLSPVDPTEPRKFTLEAAYEFHATWDTITQREQEIDAELLKQPDYNRSHLRIAEQVCDLVGKTDYRSRRQIERLACHVIQTLCMMERDNDEHFYDHMRDHHKWFIRLWHLTTGEFGADLRILDETPSALDALPDLPRINVWQRP